jgi:fatty acid desaturase
MPVGTFPHSSGWPIVLAGGLVIGGAGIIYGPWLTLPGLVIVVASLVGLMQESRPA